ncbi:hypothetical protein LCGC14_2776330 [marine sediment metagenome]|uniref:Uncharacterized protein n=1 Tax=marine sediment metagenome TaxID=412755 RepID=A0A0F8YUL3_9ZZZZ
MPDTAEDFEAKFDLETLTRAQEIMNNPGRVARAKQFAEAQRDRMNEAAKNLGTGTRVSNMVRGSRMQPKG